MTTAPPDDRDAPARYVAPLKRCPKCHNEVRPLPQCPICGYLLANEPLVERTRARRFAVAVSRVDKRDWTLLALFTAASTVILFRGAEVESAAELTGELSGDAIYALGWVTAIGLVRLVLARLRRKRAAFLELAVARWSIVAAFAFVLISAF